MNVLLIPSWYPNGDYFMNGIFIKEQAYAMAESYPEMNIGVSLWGQNRNHLLLWAKDGIRNLDKIRSFYRQPKDTKTLKPLENLVEIETPTLTWSDLIFNGNLRGIFQAHQKNLIAFKKQVGVVHLIHAQVSHKAGVIAHWLSKGHQIPYIITEQMSPFPFSSILRTEHTLKAAYRKAFDHAALNISISPDLMAKMAKLGIPRLRYIPNLVDEDFFSPPLSLEKRPSFTFFTLCEMRDQKDLPTLLKAVATIRQRQPSIRFRIGGFGEELSKNQKLAKVLEIDDIIEWLGPLDREQAREEFQKAHAFVLCSKHETFGVVFAEAIACGIPIIATRCGGPECIVTPENGVLVDIEQPQQLAYAMESLVKNYRSYQPTSIRQTFLKNFSKSAVCSQLMDAYTHALSF